MKRHVTASLVIVAMAAGFAAYYQAPFLTFLAIPSGIGLLLVRSAPRAGAAVCAFAGLLVTAISVANAVSGPSALDLTFDVVNGSAGAIALVDGTRSAFSRTQVTDLAAR